MPNETRSGTSLLEIYEANIKPGFAARLQQAQSLEDAGRAVQEELEPLFDPKGPFLGDMPLDQRDVARRLLAQITQAARLLRKILATSLVPARPRPLSGKDYQNDLSPAVLAGAMAAIVSQLFHWFVAPLIGAATGVGCAFAYWTIRPARGDKQQGIELARLEPEAILQWVQESLEDVERTLRDTVQKPPPPERRLESFLDVTGFLQGLLAEAAIPGQTIPEAFKFPLKQIPRLLANHGITVREYDSSIDGTSPQPNVWMVEREKGVALPQTLCPVFLKDGQVLCAGRVVLSE